MQKNTKKLLDKTTWLKPKRKKRNWKAIDNTDIGDG
jgi:hypothetical protein